MRGSRNARHRARQDSPNNAQKAANESVPGLYDAMRRISKHVLRELKTEAIDSWPTPTATSETELRSFFGLAGYYRRVVPGFSALLGWTKTRKRRIPDQKKILDSYVYIFVHFVNQNVKNCKNS